MWAPLQSGGHVWARAPPTIQADATLVRLSHYTVQPVFSMFVCCRKAAVTQSWIKNDGSRVGPFF